MPRLNIFAWKMDSKDIVSVLFRVRKDKGYSRKALSGMTGIGQSSIKLYEDGKRVPDLDTLVSWCAALNKEVLLIDMV